MRIVTTLDHTPSGRPVIRAKSRGMQKSTNYDHGLSHDTNHGHAAANLILAMEEKGNAWVVGDVVENITEGNASHTTENGAKHVFEV